MRRLAAVTLASAILMVAAPALEATTRHVKSHAAGPAGDPCAFASDRTAFDIEGLKSQLMVTALACKQQDKYNEFMIRYKPDVAREEAALGGYFKRAYGRQYQKAYDDYISNLANVQEQDGLKAGTSFCENLTDLFDEVMSLHDSSELHDFANSKAIVQPVDFRTCSASPIPVTTSRKARSQTKKRS